MVPARSLLLSDAAANRTLGFLVGVLVFLVTLVLLATTAVYTSGRAAAQAAKETWVILAPLDTSRNTAVRDLLATARGVRSVRALELHEKKELLGKWLTISEDATSEDILPFVLEVAIDPVAPPKETALAENLKAIDGAAVLDAGEAWKHGAGVFLEKLQKTLVIALAMLVLVLLGLVYLVTKITLQHNLPVLNLLHLMGATDKYILGRFQIIAARLVAPPSLIGFMLAVGVAIVFISSYSHVPLATSMTINWLGYAGLPALFITIVAASLFTCRQTVRRHLINQEQG